MTYQPFKMKKPKGRNDGHLFDYTKIDEHIYIGSNLCKGNVCPIHSEDFKLLGVCVEINLDDERKEIPPDDIESYTWMPVVDGYAPNEIQLSLGTSIMNEAITNGRTVYVHCRNGHGRSPTLVAAYYIRYKNMTTDKAIKFIEKSRPEVHIEDRQRKALDEFSKK